MTAGNAVLLCRHTRICQRVSGKAVTKGPNRRRRAAEQFQVAEHPGSKRGEVGPSPCPARGDRSCLSSLLPSIFSSPDRLAPPKCTRCFVGFALFETLTLDVSSTWHSFRVTYRILSNLRPWDAQEFFRSEGWRLTWLELPRFTNKLTRCSALSCLFRRTERIKKLSSELSPQLPKKFRAP